MSASPPPDAVLYHSWPQAGGGVRLEYMSDGAAEVMEVSADELGTLFSGGRLPLYGVDEAEFYRAAGESLERHAAWRAEFGWVGPKTGRRRWLRAADFPHRTPAGVPYFVGVITDVTGMKAAEEAADRAYRRLDAHLTNLPLAVVEWDDQFRVTRWSPQAEGLFGWAEAEALGRHPDDLGLVHPADRQRVGELFARMTTGGAGHAVLVNRNRHQDGHELMVEWHTSALPDPAGGVGSFLSFARDLTAQHAVELELTLSEERLRTALRATSLMVWDFDRNTGQAYYSDPVGEFYGVPEVGPHPEADAAVGVIHPDTREQTRAAIRAALERDEPYTIEFRGAATGDDGGPRWFATSGRSVFGPDGAWVRHIGVTADVTARKRAEDDRQALDRQLSEARRYDSLGVLAGGLAHDFNNLLTIIHGNAEVAKAAVGPGSAAVGPLAEVEAASKRAAHLCSQMTAYAGVGRMQVGAVDAAALLRQMEPTLRTDAAPARLTLSVAHDLPPLLAEPFQVRQAVRNVVTNAGEATPPDGWVRLEVGTCTLAAADSGTFVLPAPPGEYVVVRVADTGSGMTVEVKAKAFDPFFSTRFAGRGLGLAAVLGIVRGHRGGVRFSSAPGRGTLVELLFPVATAAARTLPRRSAVRPFPPRRPAPPRPPPGGPCWCATTR